MIPSGRYPFSLPSLSGSGLDIAIIGLRGFKKVGRKGIEPFSVGFQATANPSQLPPRGAAYRSVERDRRVGLKDSEDFVGCSNRNNHIQGNGGVAQHFFIHHVRAYSRDDRSSVEPQGR